MKQKYEKPIIKEEVEFARELVYAQSPDLGIPGCTTGSRIKIEDDDVKLS